MSNITPDEKALGMWTAVAPHILVPAVYPNQRPVKPLHDMSASAAKNDSVFVSDEARMLGRRALDIARAFQLTSGSAHEESDRVTRLKEDYEAGRIAANPQRIAASLLEEGDSL